MAPGARPWPPTPPSKWPKPDCEMDAGFTAWKNAGYPVAERVKKNPG
jgi:hypothetical protein